MRLFFAILVLFLCSQGLQGQTAGWNSAGSEALLPAGNEPNSAFEIRVFPNPVQDRRVNIEMTEQAIQEIRITNIAGSVVFARRFQVPVNRHQIVLENVPSGVYLLRIISDNNLTRTTKLTVRNQ